MVDIAVRGAACVQRSRRRAPPDTEWVFEYSPGELHRHRARLRRGDLRGGASTCGSRRRDDKIILNLPATVEMSTPNVYADQIEWFGRHIARRDSVIVSLHPHNDRGTGVAATELALMAGADRVEGTLFGNGERTGNVDLVTLALNLYTQGVDPGLDFSDINEVARLRERCTQLPDPPAPALRRRPGLHGVFRLAPGCDQERASRRGRSTAIRGTSPTCRSIRGLGRSYEAIIRVNSQSGKGGVAYLLERDYGMHAATTADRVQPGGPGRGRRHGKELTSDELGRCSSTSI